VSLVPALSRKRDHESMLSLIEDVAVQDEPGGAAHVRVTWADEGVHLFALVRNRNRQSQNPRSPIGETNRIR